MNDRFLSADPIIQDPSNSQCLNRYSYCNNNPFAAVDPSGFSCLGDLWHDVCDFAAVSQSLSSEIASIDITRSQAATMMSRGLAAGVVGGTVAATTGGNFENGMITSAFAEMFNDELHRQSQNQKMQEDLTTKIKNGLNSLGNTIDTLWDSMTSNFSVELGCTISDNIAVHGSVNLSSEGWSISLGTGQRAPGIDADASLIYETKNLDETGLTQTTYFSLGDGFGIIGGNTMTQYGSTQFVGIGLNLGEAVGSTVQYRSPVYPW